MLCIVGIFGLCVGSFLNVLIDRLPQGKDVFIDRSRCDHCNRMLSWYELIPIVSFLWQRGKSRCCHKTVSYQHPLMELVTAIGFIVLWPYFPSFLSYFLVLAIYGSLLVIFVVDYKQEIILLEMVLFGGIASICYFLLIYGFSFQGICLLWQYHGIPAFFSALFFFLLWFFSKGKAMGDGDIFLAGFIGFLAGFPKSIIAFYGAFLTGALLGVILILQRKKTLRAHIPFGPFLIVGLVIALVWGNALLSFWRHVW